MIGLAPPDAAPLAPPFDDTQVAVYPVTGLPPLFAGPVNPTDSEMFLLVVVPIAGAPGTVIGTAGPDAADGTLVPSALVAVTAHV